MPPESLPMSLQRAVLSQCSVTWYEFLRQAGALVPHPLHPRAAALVWEQLTPVVWGSLGYVTACDSRVTDTFSVSFLPHEGRFWSPREDGPPRFAREEGAAGRTLRVWCPGSTVLCSASGGCRVLHYPAWGGLCVLCCLLPPW